ncbi:MAG: hypothetical protein WDW36_003515 [Sanguina aurantia]
MKVATRLLQKDAFTTMVCFFVCTFLLLFFFTFSSWLRYIRAFLAAIYILKDNYDDQDQGVPEFAVATNPSYEHAFTRMEDFDEDDNALMHQVSKLMVSQSAIAKAMRKKRQNRSLRQLRSFKTHVRTSSGRLIVAPQVLSPGIGDLNVIAEGEETEVSEMHMHGTP